MRLPAVAIAAAFAGGIAIGLRTEVAAHASSRGLVVGLFVLVMLGLGIAAGFLFRGFLWSALASAAFCWCLLGVVGAVLSEQPLAADHVTVMVARGAIDLHTPLRWHGVLRDEPARLPWGYGYDVELAGVDFDEDFVPVRGGLRISYSPRMDAEGHELAAPDVHVGDEISVTTEARLPQVFRDEGAFDRRAFLAAENIDLVATLRAPELMERVAAGRPTLNAAIARARRRLREEVDMLFGGRPEVAGVLRAMLLGDRSFVDRAESTDFQRTGVYHVLVVAGLHVGAIALVLFWVGRRLRLPIVATVAISLALLFLYVLIVEQRPPVMRAALMVGVVLLGGIFFRRLELLNSAAVAALIILVARPALLADASFQLTFVAIGCIAGISAPWIEARVQPYARALYGWRDVRRDAIHEPKAAQFRIDLRSASTAMFARMPAIFGKIAGDGLALGLGVTLRVFELLIITLVLQVGMQPLMTSAFHRVTLASPIVNMLAVPMMTVIVPLGFAAILGGALLPATGRILAAPLNWLTAFLLSTVRYFSGLGRWSYRVPGPPLWLVVFFFCAAILLIISMRFAYRWSKIVRVASALILLGACVVIAIYPFGARWNRGELELTILDVGQGDALFMVSPGGKTMLIDGGGAFGGFPGRPERNGIDPGEEAVSPYLWSRGFKKIDFVAVTHGHQDHLGGLTAVLENFRVGTLLIGREVSAPALAKLEDLARSNGVVVAHELRGEKLRWDGAEGDVLWPESAEGSGLPAKNNDSIVMRWAFGSRAFMLPGDAEKQAEREILAESPAGSLRADVLKVGHHGSKNSTTEEFLAAVHPRVAVISAGADNPYGHPSPELLERLEKAGVRVLRTDRDGAVHILTDGTKLEISCFVSCPEPAAAAGSAQPQAPDNQ
jgi:competence protein ComEC